MSGRAFKAILDTLAEQYGRMDNQVKQWAGHQHGLLNLIPGIEQALAEHFRPGSTPIQTFARGRDTYTDLLAELSELTNDSQTGRTAAAYLNLRFYIMLNGFLQACQEALDKFSLNASLDPAELVQKSYYTPYFFERSNLTRVEMIRILEDEIVQLQSVPRDRSGIMQAMRIRKGVYATLAETYCLTHPWLYPLVQELDAIKASRDPGVIDQLERTLKEVLASI